MNAITVSVDFADFLEQTLPHNAKHFEKMLVVTTPRDTATIEVAKSVPNVEIFTTDAFTRDGAWFNKGLAIEEGFDVLGREGWITVMDADIAMTPWWTGSFPIAAGFPRIGDLYSPYRHMWPSETWNGTWDWSRLPIFPDKEFAGYFQMFHASDPVLVTRPWYGVDWINACGDSTFQAKWPPNRKLRPCFRVLHIGRQAGKYRFGRSREAQIMTRKYNAMRRPGDNYINEKIRRPI